MYMLCQLQISRLIFLTKTHSPIQILLSARQLLDLDILMKVVMPPEGLFYF